MVSRNCGFRTRVSRRWAAASASPMGTTKPVTPSNTTSAGPSALDTTTGNALEQASRMATPKLSRRLRATKISRLPSAAGTSLCGICPLNSTQPSSPRFAAISVSM
ncbi:hypothetical protein D3C72_1787900 [compost metagenome]